MLYSADISEFQPQGNDSYPYHWLTVRCCDGDHLDVHAQGNADWCRGAVVEGRLVGWTAYVVYRPGMNAAVLNNLARIVPLDRVMVDVESWGGEIRGNHATEINSLAGDCGAIVGPENVWVYGNTSDLAAIDPGNRYLVVIAKWGPTKPTVPNMVGWQYTSGPQVSGGRPTGAAPFGPCDFNELYVDELSPSGGGVLVGGNGMPWTDDYINRVVAAADMVTYLATNLNSAIGDVLTDHPTLTGLNAQLAALPAAVAAQLPATTNLTATQVQAAVTAAIEGLTFGVKTTPAIPIGE